MNFASFYNNSGFAHIEWGNLVMILVGIIFIYLAVKKDDSLGKISGIVKNRDGSEFIKDALVLIGNDTTTTTNELGIFKITLPAKMQVKDEKSSYLLTIKKEGYRIKTEYYYPKSGDIEIRLEKSSP